MFTNRHTDIQLHQHNHYHIGFCVILIYACLAQFSLLPAIYLDISKIYSI